MRYVKPYYREVDDDNRFGGILIPFIGGALIGGLFAANRPMQNYIPYNYYPQYPMTYQGYPMYQTTYASNVQYPYNEMFNQYSNYYK